MKLSHLFFWMLIVSSCTFEPEGLNYVEVEKPTASHPLELTLSLDEDSIYLYGDTQLSFDLLTFGKKFNVAMIHYYDRELSTEQSAIKSIFPPINVIF